MTTFRAVGKTPPEDNRGVNAPKTEIDTTAEKDEI